MAPKKPAAKLPKPVKGVTGFSVSYVETVGDDLSFDWRIVPETYRSLPPKPRKVK